MNKKLANFFLSFFFKQIGLHVIFIERPYPSVKEDNPCIFRKYFSGSKKRKISGNKLCSPSSRCQIVLCTFVVSNCPWCQIVLSVKLSKDTPSLYSIS